MLSKMLLLTGITSLSALGLGRTPPNDENLIRTQDSIYMVGGYRYALPPFDGTWRTDFTITGEPGDLATSPWGGTRPLGELAGMATSVVRHSGGRTSYRFTMVYHPLLSGFTVSVRGRLGTDTDRIW